MPAIGYICEKTQESLPWDDCIDCASSRRSRKLGCDFSVEVLYGIFQELRDWIGLSVTMLSNCPRNVYLSANNDYYIKPGSGYWAFRGQIAHKIMELNQWYSDVITEKRYSAEYKGIALSGKPDVVIPSFGLLKDYKTTKAVPSFANKEGIVKAYANHDCQLNLYRWILEQNEVKVNYMEVEYYDMEKPKICPVELWGNKKITNYLDKTLIPLNEYFTSSTLPPYQANWQCNGYCNVSTICYKELRK